LLQTVYYLLFLVFTGYKQAFSFEMGHFWPVEMARLARVCMSHKWHA